MCYMEKLSPTKKKHTNVKYTTDDKTTKFTNDPLFQHMAKIDENTFEVTLHKSTIKHDLQIQIGFGLFDCQN